MVLDKYDEDGFDSFLVKLFERESPLEKLEFTAIFVRASQNLNWGWVISRLKMVMRENLMATTFFLKPIQKHELVQLLKDTLVPMSSTYIYLVLQQPLVCVVIDFIVEEHHQIGNLSCSCSMMVLVIRAWTSRDTGLLHELVGDVHDMGWGLKVVLYWFVGMGLHYQIIEYPGVKMLGEHTLLWCQVPDRCSGCI